MERRLSVALRSELAETERLAGLVEEFLESHDLPPKSVMEVNLALEEVVVNIIHHAFHDEPGHAIRVEIDLDSTNLIIRVEDGGEPFDPLTIPPPDLTLPLEERPIGGLGIHLVRRLMTSISYARINDANQLTLMKQIA